MAKNYFDRYVWLINLIGRHGHISFADISRAWARSPLNVGESASQKESYLPQRTFFNHIAAIFDVFGIEIKCDRSLGYYIANGDPEPEYYRWFCQQAHGLCEEDTDGAPVFPKVWEKIAPLIEGLPLVAHNSLFDESCLKEVFQVYQMDYPDYTFYDTLSASRQHFGYSLPDHQLQTVAAACGYDLTRHHYALADAEACACIALKLL